MFAHLLLATPPDPSSLGRVAELVTGHLAERGWGPCELDRPECWRVLMVQSAGGWTVVLDQAESHPLYAEAHSTLASALSRGTGGVALASLVVPECLRSRAWFAGEQRADLTWPGGLDEAAVAAWARAFPDADVALLRAGRPEGGLQALVSLLRGLGLPLELVAGFKHVGVPTMPPGSRVLGFGAQAPLRLPPALALGGAEDVYAVVGAPSRCVVHFRSAGSAFKGLRAHLSGRAVEQGLVRVGSVGCAIGSVGPGKAPVATADPDGALADVEVPAGLTDEVLRFASSKLSAMGAARPAMISLSVSLEGLRPGDEPLVIALEALGTGARAEHRIDLHVREGAR